MTAVKSLMASGDWTENPPIGATGCRNSLVTQTASAQAQRLQPLRYHRDVVALLQQTENAVWSWSASQAAKDEHYDAMRKAMLRETYRLDAGAHPRAHEACEAAKVALGLEAPATLYQASDGGMNAALCYIPNEIHVVLHGPVLERLTPAELLALMGHELGHYRLWSTGAGEFQVAARILDHAVVYGSAAPSHIETARLFALHTEIYADRCAATATDGAGPAVAILVKTMTGMAQVDANSYLRQAAEIDEPGAASRGQSHPEVYLRAQAVDRWWRADADIDDWLDRRIRGPLSLATLDLTRQSRLEAMTRGFFAWLLGDPDLRSDAVITQVKSFFPDWSPDDAPLTTDALAAEWPDNSLKGYLIALACDLAMADADLRDEMLAAAADVARRFDELDLFRQALQRDLKLPRTAIEQILARTKAAPANG